MTPIRGRHALRHVGARNHTGLDDRTLRKCAARGELVQVWRGVYVSTAQWARLGDGERSRLVIAAAHQRSKRDLVISHRSAALLLGVPFTGSQSGPVDVLVTMREGTRTEHGFAKHASRSPDLEVVEEEGVRVTSVARTVVELAMVLPFRDAISAADWALAHGVSRELLLGLLDELAVGAVHRRGLRVVRFADARAESVGESKSRALIEEMGFPPPELQTGFSDAFGLIGFVDFFWSDRAVIGEFDGRIKFTDGSMLRGRSADEVFFEEKRRHDRLRGVGPRVARWMWEDLTMQRLGSILLGAGLRPVR